MTGKEARHQAPYDGTLAIASQEMLWNARPVTAMHSVGSAAASWWIALIAGVGASSMSTPPWAASARGIDETLGVEPEHAPAG